MTGTLDASADTAPLPATSGRSRSRGGRHRHRMPSHRRHRSRFFGSKNKESNFLAAVCNMIVVVLVCTALAEPQWFYVHGGSCRDQNDHTIDYLGMHMFLSKSSFLEVDTSNDGSDIITLYRYGSNQETTLTNCITKDIVLVVRVILAFCFLAILMSLLAFLFDLSAPSYKILRIIRENALFSILTVVLCVIISGLCYWVTEHFEQLLASSKLHEGSKVEVQFSISFFLITAAGSMSVLATGCNLLRRPLADRPRTRYQQLRNTYEDELEDLSEEPPLFVAREPPPYVP